MSKGVEYALEAAGLYGVLPDGEFGVFSIDEGEILLKGFGTGGNRSVPTSGGVGSRSLFRTGIGDSS